MRRSFTEEDLTRWVRTGLITPEQRDAILAEPPAPPRAALSERLFQAVYWAGALLILVGYCLLLALSWDDLSGAGKVAVSLLSLAVAAAATRFLAAHPPLRFPAEVAAVITFALAGFAVYTVEAAAGFWPDLTEADDYEPFIRDLFAPWLPVAAASALVTGSALWRLRAPLLTAGLAATLALTALAVAGRLLVLPAGVQELSYAAGGVIAAVGAALWAGAVLVDHRVRRDHAFWLYGMGLMGLTAGLLVVGTQTWRGDGDGPGVAMALTTAAAGLAWAGTAALIEVRGHRNTQGIFLAGALILLLPFLAGFSFGADNEAAPTLFLVVQLALVSGGVFRVNRVVAGAGALGLFIYLLRLALEVFGGSAAFPLALIVIGAVVLVGGVGLDRLIRRRASAAR